MARQLFEYHPVLAYRFIPNLKARVAHEAGGYLVQTNASGFRCRHDFGAARVPGRKRILLFGDSFTAGDGVSNGQRYGDRVEELLDVEVFNFGLPGSGTDQHYLAFKEFGAGLSADLTIVAVLVENIRRTAARYRHYQDQEGRPCCYAKPYFTLTDGQLYLAGVPPAREPVAEAEMASAERAAVDRGGRFATLRKIVNQVGLRDLAQKVSGYQPLPEYDDPEDSRWLLLRAILEEFLTAVPSPVILMPLPLYQHVEGTADAGGYQARFREITAGRPWVLHDPLPDLQAYPAEQRRGFRFEKDVHPTPAGHAALATSLAPLAGRLLGIAPKSLPA